MMMDETVAISVRPEGWRRLWGGLDERASTHWEAALLLLTAFLLATNWLTHSVIKSMAWVRVAAAGHPSILHHMARVDVRTLLGCVIIAFTVGAIAGAAVNRWRWLIAIGVTALALLASTGTQIGYMVNHASHTTGSEVICYRLHVGPVAMWFLVAVGAAVAMGGVAAPWIFRRVPLSVVVSSAWAWVILWWLWSTGYWVAANFATAENGLHQRLAAVAWTAMQTLPPLFVALWLTWVLRGQELWRTTLIVGGATVFLVVFGQVHASAADPWRTLLLNVHLALCGVSAAAAGAWLGTAAMRGEARRPLGRDAKIIAAIVAVTFLVGWQAEKMAMTTYMPPLPIAGRTSGVSMSPQ